MRSEAVLRIVLCIAIVVVVASRPAMTEEPPPPDERVPVAFDRVVYSCDFETAVRREWSLPITDVTPHGGRRFLGQFGNDSVTLGLSDLPAHRSVTVSFDLYVIRTWDGNLGDTFRVGLADGRTLVRTTFSNFDDHRHRQAWPDLAPGGDHPARTGAHAINTLGYESGGTIRDSVYRMAFTFEHLGSALDLEFEGSGLQELFDESWGLDNVRVIVRDLPPAAPPDEGGFLAFDGRDDCIVIPGDPSLDLRGSVTVEAWVRSGGDDDGIIFWRGDARPGHDPYGLHLVGHRMDFHLHADYRGHHMGFSAKSREPVDREWHLWSGVYSREAGMVYLYKDGVLESRAEAFGEITYDTAGMWNMIGAVDRGNWQHFKGAIREVRVWSVARSPAEITRDRNRRLTGGEAGLVGCWRFDRGTRQIARDISASRNHGVLGTSAFPDKADPTFTR